MMLKVALADDEIIVRLGIRSVVDWEANGFRYVGDASDGKEALSMIERTRPDILLTDILMPNMNGIELIETVKRRYPGMRIIVLSSHSEFEYVRQAMKLGVDDYVLKASVEPEQLLAHLDEARRKLTAERRLAPSQNGGTANSDPHEQWSDAILRLLHGTEPAEGELHRLNAWFRGSRIHVMLVRMRDKDACGTAVSPATESMRHILEQHLRKWTDGLGVRIGEREILLLVKGEAELSALHLQEIGTDLIAAARTLAGLSVGVGASPAIVDAASVSDAFRKCAEALDRSFLEGWEKVYVYGSSPSPPETVLIGREDERELMRLIECLDETGILAFCTSLFTRMKEAGLSVRRNIQTLLHLYHLFQTAQNRLGERFRRRLEQEGEQAAYSRIVSFDSIDDAQQWFENYITRMTAFGQSAARERMRTDIQALVRLIEENYASPLSLKQAAQRLNISEGYLSYLFKKETGTGFTEYVNLVRVDRAAELLRSTDLPSYSVAERVGYDNINYFGRLFKKIKGISPKQYRSLHFTNDETS